MFAKERLFLNAARSALLSEGHPEAATLYAAPGDEIPDSIAEAFGLVDGCLTAASALIRKVRELEGVALAAAQMALHAKARADDVVADAAKAQAGADAARQAANDAAAELAAVQAADAAKAQDQGGSTKEAAPAKDKEKKAGADKSGAQAPADQAA